jgi:hypothetical protein
MVYALISILALELFSFILSKSRLLLINARPAIYSKDSKNFSKGIAWRTENSAWGAWHKNNFSDTHQSECINAAYQSNEIGARDESFQNLSKKKTYILVHIFSKSIKKIKIFINSCILKHLIGPVIAEMFYENST